MLRPCRRAGVHVGGVGPSDRGEGLVVLQASRELLVEGADRLVRHRGQREEGLVRGGHGLVGQRVVGGGDVQQRARVLDHDQPVAGRNARARSSGTTGDAVAAVHDGLAGPRAAPADRCARRSHVAIRPCGRTAWAPPGPPAPPPARRSRPRCPPPRPAAGRPSAMPWPSTGEKLPLVVSPTACAVDAAPCSPPGAGGGPRWRCPAAAGGRLARARPPGPSRPRKPGFVHDTTQPRPACSGVMPGPSSWPCSGSAGLEPQRVAGAQPGRHHAGVQHGPPERRRQRRPGRTISTPSSPV